MVDYINSDAENLRLFNNTVVGNGVAIENLSVLNSLVIDNNGQITGNITICDGCEVYVKNSGYINAEFNSNDSYKLVQLVQSDYDLNLIMGINDFSILVKDADDVSWSGLQKISDEAGKIILDNSRLNFNGNITNVSDVELRGNVIVHLDEDYVLSDTPLITNVSGNGVVVIESENSNPLYNFKPYLQNNSLFVSSVRNTDYAKILKNDSGAFLNELRNINPDSGLIMALDSASSMEEINTILSKSFRMNPINLIKPIQFFNTFEILKSVSSENVLSLSPAFLFSDSFDSFGANLHAAYNINDSLNIGGSLYTSIINYSDSFENIKSYLYGGNVHIAYFDDALFASIKAGMTLASFNINEVFYNGTINESPIGMSFYSVADLGTRFVSRYNFSIAPFVRAVLDSANILNFSDDFLYAGIGANITFNKAGYDFDYKYGINFSAYTNRQLYIGAQMKFDSIADAVGATFDIGLLRNTEGAIGYKLAMSINIAF